MFGHYVVAYMSNNLGYQTLTMLILRWVMLMALRCMGRLNAVVNETVADGMMPMLRLTVWSRMTRMVILKVKSSMCFTIHDHFCFSYAFPMIVQCFQTFIWFVILCCCDVFALFFVHVYVIRRLHLTHLEKLRSEANQERQTNWGHRIEATELRPTNWGTTHIMIMMMGVVMMMLMKTMMMTLTMMNNDDGWMGGWM